MKGIAMDTNIQHRNVTPACEKLTPMELEQENARLHRLVADLLVRNQQLRTELITAQHASTSYLHH
jgi:hypothetical protein